MYYLYYVLSMLCTIYVMYYLCYVLSMLCNIYVHVGIALNSIMIKIKIKDNQIHLLILNNIV